MNEMHDVDVLNQGLQGEYFGIAAYDAALGTGLLSDRVTAVARQFQADHRAHAQAIREAIERLGGRADAPKTWAQYAALYPPPKLASEVDVLRYAASLERSAAIADTKAVAKLRDPALRTLCARIGGVEAMHWALLRSALGEPPIPESLLPVE
jgi:Ferritin-like domain